MWLEIPRVVCMLRDSRRARPPPSISCLQQRMGSAPPGHNSRKKSYSGRSSYMPRVEVFTSTLHTVFMAFANRQTLTMGRTGFSRFGKECPGLIKPASESSTFFLIFLYFLLTLDCTLTKHFCSKISIANYRRFF